MTGFAVVGFLAVVDGETEEVSQEAATIDDALGLVRELATAMPTFHAITLVHVEDLPKMLQGATRQP